MIELSVAARDRRRVFADLLVETAARCIEELLQLAQHVRVLLDASMADRTAGVVLTHVAPTRVVPRVAYSRANHLLNSRVAPVGAAEAAKRTFRQVVVGRIYRPRARLPCAPARSGC